MNNPGSCIIEREIAELEQCKKAYHDAMAVRPYSAEAVREARKLRADWCSKYSSAIARFSDIESLEKIEKIEAPNEELRGQLEMRIILSEKQSRMTLRMGL